MAGRNVHNEFRRGEAGRHQLDGGNWGFARVVRDFSERHEQDEKLRHSLLRTHATARPSTIAGVVSGEFDRIAEVNDTFLNLVGYTREDLAAGGLHWPELTPPEY